jgi:hypothetical protein
VKLPFAIKAKAALLETYQQWAVVQVDTVLVAGLDWAAQAAGETEMLAQQH